PPHWAFHSAIHVVPADGGAPHRVGETFDGQPALIGWSADGRWLYYTEARGTLRFLAAMDRETGESTPLTAEDGLYYEFSLNPTRTHFGFRREAPEQFVEVFVSPAEPFAPTQVSQANIAVPRLPFGKTEVI